MTNLAPIPQTCPKRIVVERQRCTASPQVGNAIIFAYRGNFFQTDHVFRVYHRGRTRKRRWRYISLCGTLALTHFFLVLRVPEGGAARRDRNVGSGRRSKASKKKTHRIIYRRSGISRRRFGPNIRASISAWEDDARFVREQWLVCRPGSPDINY